MMTKFKIKPLICLILLVQCSLLFPVNAAERQANQFSTHVIDTYSGQPGNKMHVILERQIDETWERLAERTTDSDGLVDDLYPKDQPLQTGTYRLVFDAQQYFHSRNQSTFFPKIEIIFQVNNPESHYHIPLVITPFSYFTYQGN